MVNQSDNNDKKSISAEALYALYQHKRPVASQTPIPDSDSNSIVDASNNDNTLLAENVYKHYQATRVTDEQGSIDAIMQKIDRQSISNMLQQDEQPSASLDAPMIHEIDAKTVTMDEQLGDEQIQADAPAANNSSMLKRFLLPGVAAAILGVVLIPMMITTDPDPDGLQATLPAEILPAELIDQAVQTMAFIEAPENGSFGFADTTNAAQVAFYNGVITTDLELLVEADQSTKTQQFLRTLVAAQNSVQQDSTSETVNELSDKVQSSAIGMSDAIGAAQGKEALQEHLLSINIALEAMARESDQLDWYVAGRSVESIRVAAEYALENSELMPLERALLLANQLTPPTSEAPASAALPELLQADLSDSEKYVKANELLNKANDIKLLMQ